MVMKMIDKKTIVAVAVSAAVTLLATSLVAYAIGVFARGSEALTDDQIKKVIKEVMITDEEKTYAQTLVEINNRLTVIETNTAGMQRALDILTE